MKRNKLKLDTLRVESFEAGPAGPVGRGTVRAYEWPDNQFAPESGESGPVACASQGANLCYDTTDYGNTSYVYTPDC